MWLPVVVRDDSNDVLKRVVKCIFSMMTQVCCDSQTLAFQIRPAVWISIENTHTDIDTHCPLFSR